MVSIDVCDIAVTAGGVEYSVIAGHEECAIERDPSSEEMVDYLSLARLCRLADLGTRARRTI